MDTVLAMAAVGPGAVSVYSNAYTLFQLPYAVIAVTVITAVLPRMSRSAADRDLAQVTANLSQSLWLSSVRAARRDGWNHGRRQAARAPSRLPG
ncbi:hypothetical protein Acor_31280 [Acrocarpospora corrugata]|uniref:Uncharacterized protein n=1 Tax=Acrocarpospora corrugata TaxID=35763 RepID=A0A5M3VXA2_9ACTN|nr:lipid II flippase MurJ [Acrocarpospora corrugata]GES01064.1 hypothetical protein Acor_31280 [Acrocarpospora corrugata]